MRSIRRNTKNIFSKAFNTVSALIAPRNKISSLNFYGYDTMEVMSSRVRNKSLGHINSRIDFHAVATKITGDKYKVIETRITTHGTFGVSHGYRKQEKTVSKGDKKIFSFNEAVDIIKQLEKAYQKRDCNLSKMQPLSAYHHTRNSQKTI